MRKIGNRDKIERALAVLGKVDGGLVIIVHDPSETDASWLAHDPNVIAWLTSPIDPIALLTALRAAGTIFAMRAELARMADSEDRSNRETEQLLILGLRLDPNATLPSFSG